ncbi:MAG: glycerol-3-phosphate dehydrogenase [Solirubrobacteraceae bacterium]|jgi:glycerol-3-phosphate dehydrogenase|nr:glycerol-3-phosphate dehydrogenase [Solirubrobacteraceae bacterium]
MQGSDPQVAVIGGGVVGCAVAHALARRGVQAVVLEAHADLALEASGTNSGILHTGFDATSGSLETSLIIRSAALREQLGEQLGITLLRCGARLEPRGARELAAVAALARNAHANGVAATLHADGSLTIPGESVTDPVAFVRALAGAAEAGGATTRLGARVVALARARGTGVTIELSGGERMRARAAVNCAGLFADEIARMAGDEHLAIYPRKGEFLVFSPPAGLTLSQILLPVPSRLGKGVLVFPTIDGRVIAGPTAREREDKLDWSVEFDAAELIMERARLMLPALAAAEPLCAYAGLRPAGRHGDYLIEGSRSLPGLVHVAAIRSTGLSAALGIGEHVVGMLAASGEISLGLVRELIAPAQRTDGTPWWQRAARRGDIAAPSQGAAP